MAGLVVCELPGWIKVLLGAAVIVSFAVGYACHGHARSPWFIKEVCRTGEERWRLRTADGVECAARLAAHYVHPLIVILDFRLGRFRRRSVILLPDSADPEEIRRLRVWLATVRSEQA